MSLLLLVRHGQANFGMGNYDQLSDQGRLQVRTLAQALAIRGVKVDRILAGDLGRQQQTAEILSSVLGGREITVDRGWNEYDHMPLILRVKPRYRKHWLMVADLARTGNPNKRFQDLLDRALLHWVDEAVDPARAAAYGERIAEEELPPETLAAQSVTDPFTGAVLERPANGEHPLDVPDDAELPTETFHEYQARVHEALEAASARSGTTLVVSSAGTIGVAAAHLLGIPPTGWPTLQRVMVNSSVTKVVRGGRGMSLVSFNEHGHLEEAPGVKITYR